MRRRAGSPAIRGWRSIRLEVRATAMLGALAMAAPGWSAADAAPGDRRDPDVLITAVTDDPCCGSGTIAFAVAVSGRAGGAERSYFIPFMVPGQAKPRVGERCSISWRRWRSSRWHWLLADGRQIWEGRKVTDFRCRGPAERDRFEP